MRCIGWRWEWAGQNLKAWLVAIHSKSDSVCGFRFFSLQNLRQKCINQQKFWKNASFKNKIEMWVCSPLFSSVMKDLKPKNMSCNTLCYFYAELKVFAFSDNLSAENSKSSADFSIQLFPAFRMYACGMLAVSSIWPACLLISRIGRIADLIWAYSRICLPLGWTLGWQTSSRYRSCWNIRIKCTISLKNWCIGNNLLLCLVIKAVFLWISGNSTL